MKAVFTILGHPGQGRSPDQPTGGGSAADQKPSHDGRAKGLANMWMVRTFLLGQIAILLVLASIHFGLLMGGYRHQAAGATESVMMAVLVLGLLLTWTRPPWSQRAVTAAQLFATLGVLVGLVTIALGIRPGTILDSSLNVVLLLTLIAGLVVTKKGAWGVQFRDTS